MPICLGTRSQEMRMLHGESMAPVGARLETNFACRKVDLCHKDKQMRVEF